ncbi:DUF420 domain-containing protein [Marinoscillum furvescens]|uniref:DUF420 domain-containing protein n=1 Tax=Marinoscillum furvescens TaxID=1026 RepID=UPI00293919DB|nr:DUF420 domain-containing protein [Marinoscillum furvescens]
MKENKGLINVIIGVSIAIPLVVAILLFAPFKLNLEGATWVSFLPTFNAIANSTTSVLLVLALIAIKKKKVALHRNLMLSCLVLGALFLVSYVTYHASSPSTIFGDLDHNGELSEMELSEAGMMRTVYIVVLLSHIGLSIVVVPFVLLAFYYALNDKISQHRKIVKYTFPIWLYVSVTGVIVYLLISPYYA